MKTFILFIYSYLFIYLFIELFYPLREICPGVYRPPQQLLGQRLWRGFSDMLG